MTEPNRHPAVTDDERTTLANVPREAWAEGLAMLRDPSPWLRKVARLISEAAQELLLLEAYCVVLEADPALAGVRRMGPPRGWKSGQLTASLPASG